MSYLQTIDNKEFVKELVRRNNKGADNLFQLSANIEATVNSKNRYKLERNEARTELEEKNNRLFQLEKLFKGTANIFNKQHNYVEQLKNKLEQEISDKNISQEQAQHLQEDITSLETQKQELEQRITELQQAEQNNKTLRDKELADKDKEIQRITELLNKSETQITDLKAKLLNDEEKTWLINLVRLLIEVRADLTNPTISPDKNSAIKK
ncbi:6963_t:CDS:2 [Ambispora leptoticha]|uniref:6963_t:CDS:1 n=1 Tax=Ambispora leptoticha TaxID=144679 RepID=A0A9N8V0Z0_9GLOM|nr:6963_t:CDS:2 [Ambispora leptoticha]